MDRSRRNAWLITLGSGALFACSIVPMAQRMAAYNATANLPVFHAEPIVSRAIRVEGFPEGSITDVPTEGVLGAVRLDYGGAPTVIPVKKPPALNMPNLAGYDEWLKVLAVYPVVRDEHGDQKRVPGSERLVIVVRRTPEGFNPDTWGEVRRIDWVFDFYDLKRDGTVDKTTRRWPRSYAAENRLKREAAAQPTPDGPDARTIAAAKALSAFEPLAPRTFEHFVGMFVIPKLSVPDYKFTDTAFNISVLGWTLPCSMGAALAFTGGLIFALAPRKTPRLVPGR